MLRLRLQPTPTMQIPKPHDLSVWKYSTPTVRELAMMAFLEMMTDYLSWWYDVYDDERVARVENPGRRDDRH